MQASPEHLVRSVFGPNGCTALTDFGLDLKDAWIRRTPDPDDISEWVFRLRASNGHCTLVVALDKASQRYSECEDKTRQLVVSLVFHPGRGRPLAAAQQRVLAAWTTAAAPAAVSRIPLKLGQEQAPRASRIRVYSFGEHDVFEPAGVWVDLESSPHSLAASDAALSTMTQEVAEISGQFLQQARLVYGAVRAAPDPDPKRVLVGLVGELAFWLQCPAAETLRWSPSWFSPYDFDTAADAPPSVPLFEIKATTNPEHGRMRFSPGELATALRYGAAYYLVRVHVPDAALKPILTLLSAKSHPSDPSADNSTELHPILSRAFEALPPNLHPSGRHGCYSFLDALHTAASASRVLPPVSQPWTTLLQHGLPSSAANRLGLELSIAFGADLPVVKPHSPSGP